MNHSTSIKHDGSYTSFSVNTKTLQICAQRREFKRELYVHFKAMYEDMSIFLFHFAECAVWDALCKTVDTSDPLV